MILIGQYDSPFVRRVGIALTLYGVTFEQWPWSSFFDADKIRAYNPLTRVPTLLLDDGTVLTESHIILDYLDGLMPESARLFPVAQPARHQALQIAALATGIGDKAVSLFYERFLHAETSALWVERCMRQIVTTLGVLETERAGRGTPYWFGDRIGHADIATGAVLRFLDEAHPGIVRLTDYPSLAAFSARLEALPVFRTISQKFIPPVGPAAAA